MTTPAPFFFIPSATARGGEILVPQIDGHAVIPIVRRYVGNPVSIIIGRIVDENIHRTKPGLDFLERGMERVEIGQIAMAINRRRVEIREAVGQGLARFIANIQKHHLCTLTGEPFGQGRRRCRTRRRSERRDAP